MLSDGNLLKISDIFELIPYDGMDPLPRRCSNVQIIDDHVIALDEKSLRLYINGKEVASGITSYFIHSDFLMVTTVKHTLKCLPIKQLPKYLSESMWSSESVR